MGEAEHTVASVLGQPKPNPHLTQPCLLGTRAATEARHVTLGKAELERDGRTGSESATCRPAVAVTSKDAGDPPRPVVVMIGEFVFCHLQLIMGKPITGSAISRLARPRWRHDCANPLVKWHRFVFCFNTAAAAQQENNQQIGVYEQIVYMTVVVEFEIAIKDE